jgi:CTP synthase
MAKDCKVEVVPIEAEELLSAKNAESGKKLKDVDGILVPGGFGSRGVEGKIAAIKYAREHKIPFLGICLGMQCTVIEYARNVLGWKDANSTEFDEHTTHPVIDLMEEQRGVTQKGGTMRLGAYPCRLEEGSVARAAYGEDLVYERHRHRFEVNNAFRGQLADAGLVISGQSPSGRLVEMVELPEKRWFVATQAHPEFKSRPTRPHPLFAGFVAAATALRDERDGA